MNIPIELIHGLPQRELLEKIHFYRRQGEIAERALGFYLLEMQERRAFRPERDAAAWAWKHLGLWRADKLILLARRLEELPEIEAAFGRGEVPWTKVREIARVAAPETEREWLALARRGTSREIENAVAGAKRGDRPGDGLKSRRKKFVERFSLSGEQKAIWEQGLRKVLSELGRGSTPAEAAVEMAHRALLSDPEGNGPGRKARGGGAFLVVFHRGKDGAAWVETDEGRQEVEPAAIEEVVRAGARTMEVQEIEGAGECPAIPFGRRGKAAPEERDAPVPAELKEAVLARDGRCLVCGAREDLTPHHLDSHADGGRSAMERLATLCLSCQGEVHQGDVLLRVEADGTLAVLDREGQAIGKCRSAAEVLSEASEACPLVAIVRREAEQPAERAAAPGIPTFPSLEALPEELSAAEWRAIEARCDWSPGHRAFLFHPDREKWTPEIPPPPLEEPRSFRGIRPRGFEEFVGQRRAVESLLLAGRAARERGEPLGRVLLGGPPGLGKTSLSRLLARERGSGLLETAAGNIGGPHQLVSLLARLRDGGFIFIDEAHRLDNACEEALYSALEDGVVSVMLREAGGSGGAGAASRSVRIRLERFTLVAATTRVGALSEPLRARFKHIERLEPYGEDDLAALVAAAAWRLGTAASPEAAREVASRSRGTPREAVRLLERARDAAQLAGSAVIDLAHVGQAAELLGIDEHGLDRVEQAAVRLLLDRGRPLGREALSARLGIDLETLRDVHEPWLERAGLIERREGGRVATPKARALYGWKPELDRETGGAQKSRSRSGRLALEAIIPDLRGGS